jgi:hypothetical protein
MPKGAAIENAPDAPSGRYLFANGNLGSNLPISLICVTKKVSQTKVHMNP